MFLAGVLSGFIAGVAYALFLCGRSGLVGDDDTDYGRTEDAQ